MSFNIINLFGWSEKPHSRMVTITPKQTETWIHDSNMKEGYKIIPGYSAHSYLTKTDDPEPEDSEWKYGLQTLGRRDGLRAWIYQGDDSRTLYIGHSRTHDVFTVFFKGGYTIWYESKPIVHEFDGGKARFEITKNDKGEYVIKLWEETEQSADK